METQANRNLKEDIRFFFPFHTKVRALRRLCSEKLSEAQILSIALVARPEGFHPEEIALSTQFKMATPRPTF